MIKKKWYKYSVFLNVYLFLFFEYKEIMNKYSI